jgi:lipoyl(octanoyl) transferase
MDPGMREQMWVCELGLVPYGEALAMQEQVAARRGAEQLPDTLLLVEHPPVYTRGRRADDAELLHGEGFYRARGLEVIDTDRGGRITYHGPGQLIGYPIMRVGEGVLARSRSEEGADFTGVWVGDRKIASIGVHVARGVSTHGFAINVNNELEPFSLITACGLPDVQMTSLERELQRGALLDTRRFRAHVVEALCAAFHRRARPVEDSALTAAELVA